MATKTRQTNVNINYTVNDTQIAKSNVLLEKASRSTDKLRGEANKAGVALKSAGDEGVKSFSGFRTVLQGISFAALSAGIISITRKIFALGVAQEQTNIAFNTLVGNTEKAKKLLADLMKFSIATPFTPDQVNKAAKTLLAFGVVAEDILPTLKFLGDVSSGTGKDLSEMAVIFGQIRSTGRLMGQDLLQLINAGFNPLQIISQKTGKSMLELKKDMEAGLISFDMVKQAFQDATNEGGLFFNLMEKQSQSIGGKLSTVEGNIEEIAKKLFEARSGGMSAFADGLVEITGNIDAVAGAINKVFDMVLIVSHARLFMETLTGIKDALKDEGEAFEEMQKRRRQIWEDSLKKQTDDTPEVVKAIGLIQALEEKIKSLQNAIKASTDKSELGIGGTLVKELKAAQDEMDKLLGKENKGKKKDREKEGQEIRDYLASLSDQEMFQTKATLKDKTAQRKDSAEAQKRIDKNSFEHWKYYDDLKRQKQQEAADEEIRILEDAAEQRRRIQEFVTNSIISSLDRIVATAFLNNDRRLQDEYDQLRRSYDTQIELAGDNERKQQELEIKFQRDKEAIDKKRGLQEKKKALINIAIDTAVNAVKLFAQTIPPGILSAIAVAFGAAQAGIVSQQKFAAGVIDLKGPGTKTSDSIPARLSRGESVMTADETQSSKGIFKAVRARKLNDRVLHEIMSGRSGGSAGVSFDDSKIINELRELKNASPDIVERGGALFKLKKKSDTFKQYIRLNTIGKL